MEKLDWTGLEYEEKDRSKDWFWALGIIVVTSSIASIIFENYFFAALLILGGVLLGFLATKKPDLIPYELNTRGLKIKSQLYPYDKIKSFWVQAETKEEETLKPMLFIKTERLFMPIISIPIESMISRSIRSIMLSKDIIEEEMKEHASQKIMEHLGF